MSLIAIAIAISGTAALAASGAITELPSATSYSQTGLQLAIDTTWAGEVGYRPVVCSIRAPQASAATRQLTIQFFVYDDRSSTRVMTVEQHFQLTQGEESCAITLLVPQYRAWGAVGWNLWVDGLKDEELSVDLAGFASPRRGRNLAVLICGDANEFVPRSFLRNLPGGPVDVLRMIDDPIPDDWVYYSNIDTVIMTSNDLDEYLSQALRQRSGLVRWVRTGGNLWIIDDVDGYEAIVPLSKSLELRRAEEMPRSIPIDDLPQWGWQFLRVNASAYDELEKLRQFVHPLELEPIAEEVEIDLGLGIEEDEQEPLDSREWYAVTSLGLGSVTVFRDFVDHDLKSPDELDRAISQSALAGRLSWKARHGTEPDAGNESFNDFLIPQIGAAPVTAFQVLLSLFVLGIGPLNYWFFRRREQLPLLLLTIPAAALGTILLLFAYTVLWDGVQVRVRARSLTLLDQKSQEYSCWTRLSYYAGMAPQDGLRFSLNQVVYPINPTSYAAGDRMSHRSGYNQREVYWGEDQHMRRGWLDSRTPTQYLTLQAGSTPGHIEFRSAEQHLTANNQLGTEVELLLVCDQEGKFFLGEGLAQNEQVSLQPSMQAEVISRLRSLLADNEPQFPVGAAPTITPGSPIMKQPMSQNLMEIHVSALTGLPGIWHPGMYVAITGQPGHVSAGNSRFRNSDSFHLIRGVW